MTAKLARVGFISCSGGSLIDALARVNTTGGWPYELAGVLTDRPCGAEHIAAHHNIAHKRLPFEDGCEAWSERAAGVLASWNVDVVLLLYLRRVGAAVWHDLGATVWNLHPSLLPAYPGIGALETSHAAAKTAENQRDHWLGTTLHAAAAELDAGPILLQSRFSINEVPRLEMARHMSFLQKLTLTLEGLARLREDRLPPVSPARSERDWRGRYRPQSPRAAVLRAVAEFAEPWALEGGAIAA